MSTVIQRNGGTLEFRKKSRVNNTVSRKANTRILKSKKSSVSKTMKNAKAVIVDYDIQSESLSKRDKVLELGPLESIFRGSESKILDFLIAFQEYDYSISDISKNSGVGFKTTLGVVKSLEEQQILFQKRTVGRAKMYVLNPDSQEAKSISKLALDIATKRITE